MAIRLNVPLITQNQTNSCWYAAACMVAYFRKPGPRKGLPNKWIINNGILTTEILKLAKSEGLNTIHTTNSNFTEKQLESFLKLKGPIWCAGKWDNVGHVVVLTGIENGLVYLNDPNPAKKRRVETLDWFNEKIFKGQNGMMYMPLVS